MFFQVYVRRFIVLLLFCLGNGMNEFMWNCFSPIFSEVSNVFNVSSLATTMLALCFMILFAPASFLFVYISARYGLRKTLIIGSSLQAVGSWLRYFGCLLLQLHSNSTSTDEADTTGSVYHNYFALLMIGQIFAALAQPVFTNLPPMISTSWFPVSERNRATITMVMANPIGNALGSLVPGFVIPLLTNNPTDTTRQHIRINLAYFTLGQAVLATLVAMGIILLVPDKPLSPPSAAAAVAAAVRIERYALSTPTEPTNTDSERLLDPILSKSDTVAVPVASASMASSALTKLWNEYKQLVLDKNFLFLLCGFGLGLGTFNALLALLGQILSPCNYTSTEAGITGGILLASGLLTSGIVGAYLEKSNALVPVLRVSIILGVIMTVVFLACLRPGISIGLYITSGILGAAVVPILPVGLENAAECMFGLVSEDTSASALTMTGKYSGVILTFILQPLLGLSTVSDCSTIFTPTAGIILGALLVSAVSIFCFQKDYRRQTIEREYMENHK